MLNLGATGRRSVRVYINSGPSFRESTDGRPAAVAAGADSSRRAAVAALSEGATGLCPAEAVAWTGWSAGGVAMRVAGRRVACSLVLLVLGAGSAAAQGGYDIKEFDADGSGALEPKEFAKFLQTTPAKGQPKDQVRQMFKQINTSKCNQTVCIDWLRYRA